MSYSSILSPTPLPGPHLSPRVAAESFRTFSAMSPLCLRQSWLWDSHVRATFIKLVFPDRLASYGGEGTGWGGALQLSIVNLHLKRMCLCLSCLGEGALCYGSKQTPGLGFPGSPVSELGAPSLPPYLSLSKGRAFPCPSLFYMGPYQASGPCLVMWKQWI